MFSTYILTHIQKSRKYQKQQSVPIKKIYIGLLKTMLIGNLNIWEFRVMMSRLYIRLINKN